MSSWLVTDVSGDFGAGQVAQVLSLTGVRDVIAVDVSVADAVARLAT